MEDNEIIDRFLSGETDYFDELILKYKDMVFNLCFQMLRDYEESLDLSQDIFVKLYHSIKDYRKQAKFSTYLYRITVNFCKNKLKFLERVRKKNAFSLDDPIKTDNGEIKREVADTNPTPREVLAQKEKLKKITDAISSLKMEYKEIIILREMENLAYEEIARILNVGIGTVKSRLNRARMALRDKLRQVL